MVLPARIGGGVLILKVCVECVREICCWIMVGRLFEEVGPSERCSVVQNVLRWYVCEPKVKGGWGWRQGVAALMVVLKGGGDCAGLCCDAGEKWKVLVLSCEMSATVAGGSAKLWFCGGCVCW